MIFRTIKDLSEIKKGYYIRGEHRGGNNWAIAKVLEDAICYSSDNSVHFKIEIVKCGSNTWVKDKWYLDKSALDNYKISKGLDDVNRKINFEFLMK